MQAVVVEVYAPCCHQIAGMWQTVEQMLDQALIPHPTVEAFHEPVFHPFVWRDVMPINLAASLLLQDRT